MWLKRSLAKGAGLLRRVAFFLVVLVVLTSVLDYFRAKALPTTLPDSVYTALQSTEHAVLAQSYAQLTVVYFWATWCGPCKVTSPSVSLLAKHYPVISVAMASGSDATLNAYITDKQLSFPVINDSEQTIASDWGVSVTPTVLFIKEGKIEGYTMGASGYPGLLLRAWWADKGF